MSDFNGRWFTTFGAMTLTQTGAQVDGSYGKAGALHGTVAGDRLTFDYAEPGEAGTGWFSLTRHGKFTGEYLPEGAYEGRPWEGRRDFDGIWDSSFGRLRIVHEEQGTLGFYEGLGPATLEGKLENDRLVFRYQEPQAQGEGWFELAPDGMSFDGQWRSDGQEFWQ